MKKKFFKKNLAVTVVVLILFFCSGNAFGRLVLNGTESGFSYEGSEKIRVTVIEAAGYYLKSYSDYLLFLNRIEMSDLNGLDFTEALKTIDNVIFNLENARQKYMILNQLAANIPYNQDILGKLFRFDYDRFQKTYGLDGRQLNMIRNYLRQGDIREIFKKTMRDTELILKKIKNLRSVLLSFNYPSMNEIWDLNQKCGEFLMFGQQVARILYTVTGKQF